MLRVWRQRQTNSLSYVVNSVFHVTSSQHGRKHPDCVRVHPSFLTGTTASILCSCRVGRSAGLPEFPDQEAEEGVLHVGMHTGRADRKQQVSVDFYPLSILRLSQSAVSSSFVHTHTQSFSFAISQLFIPSVHEASSIQAVGTDHVNTPHTASRSDLFSC